jgi:hypothetical protein
VTLAIARHVHYFGGERAAAGGISPNRLSFHAPFPDCVAKKKGKQTKREKKVNQYSKNPRMIHRNFDSHRLLSPRTTLGANRSASLISFKVTLSDISPNTNGTLLLSIM